LEELITEHVHIGPVGGVDYRTCPYWPCWKSSLHNIHILALMEELIT